MTKKLVEVNSISKEFKNVKAVNNFSFDIFEGEIFALLGPNGAGKTTTVRMLLGIINPDSGIIKYNMNSSTNVNLEFTNFGYLPEDRGLYKDIPVLKTLTYFGLLKGMKKQDAKNTALTWLEKLGLKERSRDKLETLSKGNQQKVQFIASILHRPVFAIMDEPFLGLDPVNQDLLLNLLLDLKKNGTTVLLSSHQMQLVERVADRIILMSEGHEVISGSLESIRKGFDSLNKITLSVSGDPPIDKLEKHPALKRMIKSAKDQYTFFIKEGELLSNFLVSAGEHLNITHINSEKTSSHDIFIQTLKSKTSTINREKQL